MKKIIFGLCLMFFASQSVCFADEIIDGSGNIIPCRIETVAGGLIEYTKDGNLLSFHRENNSNIFNDYVDVIINPLKKDSVKRISGTIITKDFDGVKIQNQDGLINIKNYRVKFVGVYKPE